MPEGTPVSALRENCPQCEAPIGIRSTPQPEIETGKTEQMPALDDIGSAFTPSYSTPYQGDLVQADMGNQQMLIDSFINRITPLVLAAQLVANLEQQSADLSERSVLDQFVEEGTKLRQYIQRHEDALGIGRGSRLSVAYPEVGKSSNQFIRAFFGGPESDGLAQKMGIIVTLNSQMKLTDASTPLLEISIPRVPELVGHGAGRTAATLPVWYTDDDVGLMLKFIEDRAAAEVKWMLELIGRMQNPGRGTPRLLLNDEYNDILEGKSPRNWRHPPTEITDDDGDEFDEEFIKNDKLASNIRATLKGTLSRMKELGLIYSYKKGRTTFYKPTELGYRWRDRWDEEL
jgi:hypothetical protein